MHYLMISSLLVTAVFGARKFRTMLNPASMVSLWWLLCFIYFFIHQSDYYKIQLHTLLLLLVSVHAFSFGVRSGYVYKSYSYDGFVYRDVMCRLMGSNRWNVFVVVVAIISFVFSLYGVSDFYQTLKSGNASAYRMEYYESGGEIAYGNVYLAVIRDLLLKPILYVFIGIASMGLMHGQNKYINRILLLLAITSLIMFDAAQFGRTGTVNIIFLIVFVYIFSKNNLKGVVNKYRKLHVMDYFVIAIAMIGILYFINIVSLQRQGLSILEGLDKLFSYFTLGIALFDKKEYVLPDHFNGFLYSLGGVYQMINIITRRFGFEALPSKAMDLQEFQYIGPDMIANALYTWNIAFYADFGVIGCILFPFFIGALVGMAYKKMVFISNDSSILLLSVFMVVVFAGVLEWRLMWADQLMLIILAWIMTLKKIKIINE